MGPKGQKAAGICYVKVDGMQLTITGGCEAPITEFKRESIVPGFYKEEERTPYIKVDALHTSDLPLDKLTTGTEMTVTIEFANNKVYVLSGAYLVGEPVSAGDDGKVALEFNGIKGKWQ